MHMYICIYIPIYIYIYIYIYIHTHTHTPCPRSPFFCPWLMKSDARPRSAGYILHLKEYMIYDLYDIGIYDICPLKLYTSGGFTGQLARYIPYTLPYTYMCIMVYTTRMLLVCTIMLTCIPGIYHIPRSPCKSDARPRSAAITITIYTITIL